MLINSDDYQGLVSYGQARTQKKPGKLFNCFITGKPRERQKVGCFQVPVTFENPDYLISNKEEIYFLPLLTKRYWTRTVTEKSKSGEDYEKIVEFMWDDNVKKSSPECKYEYIVSGIALDDNKQILKHKVELPEHGIKVDDPVMIYFKCSKSRCSCAVDMINAVNDKVKQLALKPLSQNPSFESSVVNPHRFVMKATIGTKELHKTTIYTFIITPDQVLPDNNVSDLINRSKNTMEDFEYQFNKTNDIVKQSSDAPQGQPVPYGEDDQELPHTGEQTQASSSDEFKIEF